MLAFMAATAVLLTLIVALLAVPVVLVIDARRRDTLEAGCRVRWLFGLVDVRAERGRPPEPPPARTEARCGRKPAGARRSRARMGLAAANTRGLPRRVERLAVALYRQVKLEGFRLRVAFGFEDPADTGIVYGILSPLLVMAERRGLNVECRPMFPEAGLCGVLNATVRVRPLAVVGVVLAFVLSPPVIRAARSAWQVRK